MSGRIDAATLLERTLIGDALKAGITTRVVTATATRWASATFVGARHRLTIEGTHNAAFTEWLGGLADADLPVRGHLVADLAVIAQAQADGCVTAIIEVLTVEEA